MINFVSVKCPECNSDLSIEEGRNTAFCTYCGAKVLINNENEHIYRYVDDAEIKKAETNHIVQMKQMELLEKKGSNDEQKNKLLIIISIILGGLGTVLSIFNNGTGIILFMILAFIWAYKVFAFLAKEKKASMSDGKIKIPTSIDVWTYKKMNYQTVETILKNAGFSNIQTMPIKDIDSKQKQKQDMVVSLTINGESIDRFNSFDSFLPSAAVLISYHSL